MHKEGDEIHVEDVEATAATSNGHLRWILAIGLVLAIGLLTMIWVTGAVSVEEPEPVAKVSENAPAEVTGTDEDLVTAEVVDEAAIEAADALAAEAADTGS